MTKPPAYNTQRKNGKHNAGVFFLNSHLYNHTRLQITIHIGRIWGFASLTNQNTRTIQQCAPLTRPRAFRQCIPYLPWITHTIHLFINTTGRCTNLTYWHHNRITIAVLSCHRTTVTFYICQGHTQSWISANKKKIIKNNNCCSCFVMYYYCVSLFFWQPQGCSTGGRAQFLQGELISKLRSKQETHAGCKWWQRRQFKRCVNAGRLFHLFRRALQEKRTLNKLLEYQKVNIVTTLH